MPEFAQPAWLLLLALLPVLAVLRARAGRREDRGRQVAGDIVRAVALALLLVALAGPLEPVAETRTGVVFALDRSSSLDADTAARALDFVERGLLTDLAETRTGLVVFGADAAVEAMPGRAQVRDGTIASHVEPGATDIARAIEVAAGALPPSGTRRIVLLTDGRENAGNARAAARVARSIGVSVWPVPLANERRQDEVSVTDLVVPARVHEREPFEVQMTLLSKTASAARVALLRDGVLLREMAVELQPGANAFTVVDESDRPGLHEYEAVVNGERDGVPENNRYQAFVTVEGAPRVLLAAGGATAPYLAEALRAQGIVVDAMPAFELPATLHALAEYGLVVLDDVSGLDLSLEKMAVIEEYVRETGGGLLTIGGESSYAAGGWYDTPLERALPVTVDVKTEVTVPSLAVGIVIDKSASMDEQVEGGRKLDVARLAALAAVEVLGPLDRVGILAFDTRVDWVVPPTEVGNRRAIAERLRAMRAGGGTDLYLALEEAGRVMGGQDAKVKHLIVLSDGLSDTEGDHEALARRLAAAGITVTTVAFGADADRALMQRIALLGEGRHYFTEDIRDVPRIFTSETLVVSRSLFVEQPVRPALVHPGDLLAGFAEADLPPLAGYQRTWAKPAAQVLLGGADGDPLLVTWRHGLGKAVSFMSDLGGRWGRDWVRWPEFGRFVAQAARWTMRHGGDETLFADFERQGREAVVTVDVLDRDERFVNGLDLVASVSGPERGTGRVALEQVAPGRYRGAFEVAAAGRYHVSVSGGRGDLRVGPRTFGLAVPYSSEYADLGTDRRLLEDLADTTGGRVLPLAAATLATVTAPGDDEGSRGERRWWPYLLASLLAVLVELVVRKVGLPASWTRLAVRLRPRPREDAADDDYDALRETMERARAERIAADRGRAFHDPDDPAARARLYVARRRA